MSARLRHLSAVAALALVIAPGATALNDHRSPDTRDQAAALESSQQDLRSPDVRDRADARLPVIRGDQPGRDIGSIQKLPATQPVVVAESFDWADAVTGAAGAIGLLALALGIIALGGRSRRTQPSV
jgi:hypothetical protein